MRLKWSVGGAFHVQETYLEFEIDKTKETFTTAPQSGGSMWAQNHGIDGYEKRFHVTEGIFYGLVRGSNVKWAYSEAVRLLKYVPASVQKTGSDMRIRAVAKVSYIHPRAQFHPQKHDFCAARASVSLPFGPLEGAIFFISESHGVFLFPSTGLGRPVVG